MADISWPFDPSTISEGYGYAEWRGGVHDGIDFAIGAGTELRAAASGTVYNNDAGADGAGVDITTDDGWKIRMWHVSQFLVSNGAYVNKGDVIALSGGIPGTWGAGRTTGAHMHFGVKIGGAWVDPAPIINGSAPSASADGSVADLAAAVIRGDFGNGAARQAALGARFDEVQAEVNRIMNGGAPTPAPAPAPTVVGDVYTVQPGDSFWAIAEKNFGGSTADINAKMFELLELNGHKRLFAGDTVILRAAPAPVPEPVVAPVTVVAAVTEEPKAKEKTVTSAPATPTVVTAAEKRAMTKAGKAKAEPARVTAPIQDASLVFAAIANQPGVQMNNKLGLFGALRSIEFWNDALTRMVNTFFQVALAAVGTGATGVTSLDYSGILDLAAAGALISFGTSIVRATTPKS